LKRQYYIAGGEKIPLEVDEGLVAVDTASSALRASLKGKDRSELARHGTDLAKGVVLVDREGLPERLQHVLTGKEGMLPVYRHGSSLIVVMPEVRVEDESEGATDRLHKFLAGSGVPASEIVEAGEGRFVIKPRSGKGEDALELANAIAEKLEPAVSQARFLRIVRRPG